MMTTAGFDRSGLPEPVQRSDMPVALVVDDAATVRLYHADILARHGFTVVQAANGVEGLEVAALEQPDLLVVDVNMPIMDGYSFLRAVRDEPALQAIPAIMISTEAQACDEEQAFAAGANLYLVKPVYPQRLGRLARMLTGRAAP